MNYYSFAYVIKRRRSNFIMDYYYSELIIRFIEEKRTQYNKIIDYFQRVHFLTRKQVLF